MYILEEFYGSFPGVSRMSREVSHVCTVLFERIRNRISNRVNHTQFMILSESIIQEAGDGVSHRFI